MKLVLSTGLLDSLEVNTLPDMLPVVREAGFEVLEVTDRLDFDSHITVLDELRRKAKECGLEIPNWHLIQYPPLNLDGTINRTAVDCMKCSMEKGHRIGAKNHVLHWDHRFLDRSFDTPWREIIDEWTNHAKKLGIRLLMETVPDKPTNQRYVPASEIIDFVRTYPPEVLAVCVDANHSNLQEELPEVIEKVKDRLVSLHISDNDGHEEKHWLPGRGVIDFYALLTSLDAVKFNGTFVLEVNKWTQHVPGITELKQLYQLGTALLQGQIKK